MDFLAGIIVGFVIALVLAILLMGVTSIALAASTNKAYTDLANEAIKSAFRQVEERLTEQALERAQDEDVRKDWH